MVAGRFGPKTFRAHGVFRAQDYSNPSLRRFRPKTEDFADQAFRPYPCECFHASGVKTHKMKRNDIVNIQELNFFAFHLSIKIGFFDVHRVMKPATATGQHPMNVKNPNLNLIFTLYFKIVSVY